MVSPSDVTAVIVTRGDVDLKPVLDSLIFDQVVVWDNSVEQQDFGYDPMTFGRVLALKRCDTHLIYSQDDDIVHTPEDQKRIIDAHEYGVLTGCMWPEWSDGARAQGIDGGYDDLVFCGSGAVYDQRVPKEAVRRYLELYPFDDFFRLWCDTIVGVISDTKQLPIEFEALPCAENDNRMCNLPDAVALKAKAIRRGREVRSRALVAA